MKIGFLTERSVGYQLIGVSREQNQKIIVDASSVFASPKFY